MKRSFLVMATFFCAALIAGYGIGQQDPAAPNGHFLPGGGVAEPTGRTGFFPGAKGGVDAIDLATGKLLWSNPRSGKPLLATDRRLVVQTGTAVHVLDTAENGKLVFEAKALGLPGWASADVGYGRSFRSSARVEGKILWLSWEARAFYAGGAAPPPEIEKAARKEASGVARIELDSGKTEVLSAEKIAAGKLLRFTPEVANPRAGALTLVVKDGAAKNPGNPFQRHRSVQALNAAKEVVWEREVAAPIFLIPRP